MFVSALPVILAACLLSTVTSYSPAGKPLTDSPVVCAPPVRFSSVN